MRSTCLSAAFAHSAASASRFARATSTRSSAPTGPARVRFSMSSAGSTDRIGGASRSPGRPLARVPTQRLAKLGVARTFQNLALFKGLSVRDNVITGRVGSARATFLENIVGWGRARREEDAARAAADAVIDFLDFGAFRERIAGSLPYGVQKRVELARALVARPRLLLLDEPMAGMTATEKQEMSGFIRAAREQFANHGHPHRARHRRRDGAVGPRHGARLRPKDRRGRARGRAVRSGRHRRLSRRRAFRELGGGE